jgi:hypothetical protein
MSGYNAMVKTNMSYFDTDGQMQPEYIRMSKGTLAGTGFVSYSSDASAHTVTLSWNPTPAGDALPNDKVYVALYHPANNQAPYYSFVEIADRSDAGTVLTATGLVAGQPLYGWVIFRRADGSKVSDSDQFTTTVNP